MAAQAAALSDADIKALAQYYQRQPGPLYTPRLNAAGSGQ
jgi:cytochrome c553